MDRWGGVGGLTTGLDVVEEQNILSQLPKIERRFLGHPVCNLVTAIPVDA